MAQDRITFSNVTMKLVNGAWIAEDSEIGNNVTIFPGAVLGRPPVSTKAQMRRVSNERIPPLIIGGNCVIGANSVIYRGTKIGNDTLVGDGVCIREKVIIGDSCIIAMGVTINYNTRVGDRVKIMDNTHITGNMIVEDDVFISTHVTTTNDNSMGREAALNIPVDQRKRQGPIIRRNATIGQAACILPAVEVGENTIVGANAVVTKSLPPRVMALGIPARVVRELRDDEVKN
jgi:acetyltransferase-like isoleucine patch superfamily enzyme